MNIHHNLEDFCEFAIPDGCFAETVTKFQHHTDRLFRFRTTRPASLRFRSGEFVMIGLPGDSPVFRAYSIASPSWDDTLEFFSIKVQHGLLTSRLQKIQPGDTILIQKKHTGTLVTDALLPGRQLWLFATGTGIAPFSSLVRDPEVYEKYQKIILVHGTRKTAELHYGNELMKATMDDLLVGAAAQQSLIFINATTCESYRLKGRLTHLFDSGVLEKTAGVAFYPACDRAMICGSLGFTNDFRRLLTDRGLRDGSNARPGGFLYEKAFVG